MILIPPDNHGRPRVHPLQAATELLQRLDLLGIRLEPVKGGFIDVRSPPGVLTDSLREEISVLKPHLLRLLRCDRCGSDRYVDHPVHDGRSLRRDCAACKRTLGFARWNPRGESM